MNGRCETDPLDAADDVCEECGGEFCSDCLLRPNGKRQPPVCKRCALQKSGLRGNTKVQRKLSKREIKQRRKALLEDRDDRTDASFLYFDETNEFELDLGNDETEETETKRRRLTFGRRKSDAVEDSDGEALDREHQRVEGLEEFEGPEPAVDTALDEVVDEEAPASYSASAIVDRIRATSGGAASSDTPPPPGAPALSPDHAHPQQPDPVGGAATSFDPTIDPFGQADLNVDPFAAPSPAPSPAPMDPTPPGLEPGVEIPNSFYEFEHSAEPSPLGNTSEFTGATDFETIPTSFDDSYRPAPSTTDNYALDMDDATNFERSEPDAYQAYQPEPAPAAPTALPQRQPGTHSIPTYEPAAYDPADYASFETSTHDDEAIGVPIFEPADFEPADFEPVAFEPVAFEPVAFEPVAFEATVPDAVGYESDQSQPALFEPLDFEPDTHDDTDDENTHHDHVEYESDQPEPALFEPLSFESDHGDLALDPPERLTPPPLPRRTPNPAQIDVPPALRGAMGGGVQLDERPKADHEADTDANGNWVPPALRG